MGVVDGPVGGGWCWEYLSAELLYRAKLNPFTPGKDVADGTLRSIWKDAGVLMKAAMVDRRIVTTKPKDRPHKKGQALKEEAHYVYRRQGRPCFVSGTKILTEVMAGRNLFWCSASGGLVVRQLIWV